MHRHFEEELEHLRTRLIRMASLVDEQADGAVRALFTGDPLLARAVIERDEKVDSFDLKIDKQVERLFILAQPVASDLRFNLAALSINKELERVGDIAVNIAELVPHLQTHRDLLDRFDFRTMATTATQMLKQSIDAFISGDADLARQVIEKDDIVDALERQLFAAVLEEIKSNPMLAEPEVHLLYLLRHIERIGDHATNIAEDVVFMVEAKSIKHKHNEDEETSSLPETT